MNVEPTSLKQIKRILKLDGHHNYGDIFQAVKTILLERDEMQGTINGLKHLVELPKSAGLTELFNAVEALELNKPQLTEIRYVLHGDIQPCSVLYSDDTTTLLRLDEGDIMCETDTIEWSDSVTYRCQELLKSVDVRSLGHVAPRLAQLVRDERILLNDNGDDVVETETRDVEAPCGDCGHVFDAQSMTCPMCMTIRSSEHPTAVVPAPPPMPHQKPDHNNPYLHTNSMFTEEAMRRHGWTNEALVSCGHGHYAPTQHPADTER